MPIRFKYDVPGWRPTWPQMIDLVERYCGEEETAEELRWLREHPTDWLMVARYMRIRAENDMAKSRKALSKYTVFDPETGRPTGEYLNAKRAADSLHLKRLKWIALVDAQIAEAKHILGWEKISDDMRAQLVDQLVMVRMALTTDQFDPLAAVGMVERILRTYAPDFDPDAYRPPSR